MLDLIGNPKDRFSHEVAPLRQCRAQAVGSNCCKAIQSSCKNGKHLVLTVPSPVSIDFSVKSEMVKIGIKDHKVLQATS